MSLEDLEQRTLRFLNGIAWKRFLAAEATSDCGRESCLALMPVPDLPFITQWLDESAEAEAYLGQQPHYALCSAQFQRDIEPA